MIETDHLLVHLERILVRIERLETPLIQIWGWPGSGMSGVLPGFLGRQGRRAAGLALGELADSDDAGHLREVVQAAHEAGVRWLVASGDPGGDAVREAARWLRPDQSLVFAGSRRTAVEGLAVAVLPPRELLLHEAEVSWLWGAPDRHTPRSGLVSAALPGG